MASVVTRSNGLREIRFYGVDGERKTLCMGRKPKKVCSEYAAKIESLVATAITKTVPDPEVVLWTAGLPAKMHAKLASWSLVAERVESVTNRDASELARLAEIEAIERAKADELAESLKLGNWITTYLDSRPDIKASTREQIEIAGDNLTRHFGKDRSITTITRTDAKAWRIWLLTQGNQRDKEQKALSEDTVRRRTGRAKQLFAEALERELIAENPFVKLPCAVRSNKARQSFVSFATINRVIESAPSTDWRTIIALARFGGLRVPSELVSLRWTDIDLPGGRMVVNAPKTEHHNDGGKRIVPIFPELRKYLQEAFNEVDESDKVAAEYVIADPLKRRMRANLGTELRRIILRAKVKPWPKAFQNLRATRETELMAKYPAKDVAEWIGNSVPVAMKHYAMATEEGFQRAIVEPTITTTQKENPHQNPHHSRAITATQDASSDSDLGGRNEKSLENEALCIVVMSGDYLNSYPARART